MQVAITKIQIPAGQIRLHPGNLQELAENIKKYGMLHPIVVNDKMELIVGYRRLKAAESLGWTEIPVTVIIQNDSLPANPLTEYDLHLSENLQRKELTPLEISDAILERKHRFEQLYGPIKHGGDRTDKNLEQSKLENFQLAQPDFYEETARLFQMGTSAIYKLLRLQGLDNDLKLKVYLRELNYAAALSEQAVRNQADKKKPTPKNSFRAFNLPNRETVELLTALFKKAPKLFQLFQLVNHSWFTTRRFKDAPLEFDQLDLEILHNFVVQLGEVLAFYELLFTQLQQAQEKILNSGKE
ncbi:MAG: ParB N-terminal domain-containing protein [bacterium]|nr:ParB N-terminal domain-containing protein [bacterium]